MLLEIEKDGRRLLLNVENLIAIMETPEGAAVGIALNGESFPLPLSYLETRDALMDEAEDEAEDEARAAN